MNQQLFFIKLWNTSKVLFIGVLLFVLGQAFFTYKGILNFPFFPFEMYAHPQPTPRKSSLYHIYINGKTLNYTELPNWTEGNILNTIKFYQKYQAGNNWARTVWLQRFSKPDTDFKELIYNRLVPSPSQVDRYPEWLASYIQELTNTSVVNLKVIQKTYLYENFQWTPSDEEKVILDYSKSSI